MAYSPLENERIVLMLQTHWIKYLWPSVAYGVSVATSLLLFVLAGIAAHHSAVIMYSALLAAAVLFIVVHHWFFQRLLSESLVDIIVTNHRVIRLKTSLLFHDDMQEILLERLRSVEAKKKGILQNLLRYGTLIFDRGTSTNGGTSQMHLIPHPHRVAHEMTQLLHLQ